MFINKYIYFIIFFFFYLFDEIKKIIIKYKIPYNFLKLIKKKKTCIMNKLTLFYK